MSAAEFPTISATMQCDDAYRLWPASHAPAQRSPSLQLDLKSVADNGEFEGYASLFNREDLGHDVISPGAFPSSRVLAASTGMREACKARRKGSIPQSNSWLPMTHAS